MMIHRLLLSSLTILTLATCQNQNAATSEKTTSVENTTVVTNPNTTSTPTKGEPKTSDGLPKVEDAVKAPEKEQANSNKKNMVYLKEGENQFLKEYEMNVTFKRMVEDSRCPKDVNCIWAGNAIAEVEFTGTYTRPVTLQFSTMSDANKGYFNTRNFNGYSISLVNLTPETTTAKGFKALKGSYKIALQFEKKGTENSPPESGGTTTR